MFFLLYFQSPHLPNPILSNPHLNFSRITETQKCMVTYEMQLSTTQILSSTMYTFVGCCLLFTFAFGRTV